MDDLREYEIRLFDGDHQLLLIAPIVAIGVAQARARAAELAAREMAHDFSVHAQMRSVNYRNTRTATDTQV